MADSGSFERSLPAEKREVLMSGKLCCNGRHLLGTASKSPVVNKQDPIGRRECALLRKMRGGDENMDPTEHKDISTSGTKVKHKPRSSLCHMDVFNMAQMLLKS